MQTSDSDRPLPELRAILDYYRRFFYVNTRDYDRFNTSMVLPVVPLPLLKNLCQSAGTLFQSEPMLLSITIPVIIIGDLHGHVLDLFRVLGTFGLPPRHNYLFLGDLVDRGEFSTEVVVLVLMLKVLFPRNVYLIRGNHEFAEMIKHGGFSDELLSIYHTDEAELAILEAFSWIPIGAMIGSSVLCVHGGIGPSIEKVSQIAEIPRPLASYDDDVVQALLWSDPTMMTDDFQYNSRGVGYFFGADALAKFLGAHGMRFLIRGHECVEGGVEFHLNKRMATVFGASNYCGQQPNKSGVMEVRPGGRREVTIFNPLPYVTRTRATFLNGDGLLKLSARPLPVPALASSRRTAPLRLPGRAAAATPEARMGRPIPSRPQSLRAGREPLSTPPERSKR
jgi:protein phosphatase